MRESEELSVLNANEYLHEYGGEHRIDTGSERRELKHLSSARKRK